MDRLPAVSHSAKDPLQKFFKACITLGETRGVPKEAFLSPWILLPFAGVLALLPLLDRFITAHAPRPRATKSALFTVAFIVSCIQIASQFFTLFVNYAVYSHNIGDASTFAQCVAEAFHFSDVSVLDRYLLLLELLRHLAFTLASFLYLALLYRHYFRLATVPRIAWLRGFKLSALYIFFLALPAGMLFLPATPDAHGCKFDAKHGRYVCSVIEWEQFIGKPSLMLGSVCDGNTATVLDRGKILGCGYRPSRRIMRGLGERLLAATLSSTTVMPRLFATLVLALCAVGVTYAVVQRVTRMPRALPRFSNDAPMLTAPLRAAALALFALHVSAWFFLDVSVIQMYSLARSAVSCGCAHEAKNMPALRAAFAAFVVAVVDGLKLLIVFAKRERYEDAAGDGTTDEASALLPSEPASSS